MDIKQLFTDDRAVSPVIGVILMVAITVILAAVIGAFVLGLGDQVSNNAPSASFEYDFESDTNLTITHAGGDNIDNSTLRVTVDGEVAFPDENSGENLNSTGWGDGTIRTGNSVDIYNASGQAEDGFSGDRVRIIWNNPSGGSSNTISDRTWP